MLSRFAPSGVAALVMAGLMLGSILPGGLVTAAQPNDQSAAATRPDATASRASLQATLDRLNRTIEKERSALKASREEWRAQRRAKRKRRDTLAKRVLEAEAERQRKKERAASLAESLRAVRDEASRLSEAAGKVVTTARQSAEALIVHLRQVPGSKRMGGRVEQAIEALPADTEDAQASPAQAKAITTMLDAFNKTHRRATSLHVRQAEIWTAGGKRERVNLLSIGHAAFAYASKKDGAIGVALASPNDASGYRWSEAIPRQHQAAIRRAIDRVKSEGHGSPEQAVAVPIDVTGRLTADAVAPNDDWFGRLRAGGVVMAPLLMVAGFGVLLSLERVWCLYLTNGRTPRVTQRVLSAVAQDDYQAAETRARAARGAVGRTLAACLARRERGQHAMEDAIQEQLLHERPRLQRFLGGIAILAAIAPLLGLLGTVTGIIETFGVIRAFGQTDPGLMAGGISEALVTTATGLVIAIPLLLVHALLRGRVDRIIAEAEKQAATLLNALSHDGMNANDARAD